MRAPNPLSEILDSALRNEEPMLDTEWPAGDVELELPQPAVERRFSDRALAGLQFERP